ncbi:S41 family peptidase [Ectothiorhodospira magna]|nr:S41 family peptidase [Ectothiorhodospira magna]
MAPPLDEIRQIMRERALYPPSEPALRSLSSATLAQDLRAVDPLAQYFPAGTWPSSMLSCNGQVGVGMDVVFQDGQVLLSPYRGGGADLAGVREGMQLLQVDGMPVVGLSPRGLVSLLQGEEGSVVTLSLLSPDADGAPRVHPVTRQSFQPLEQVPAGPTGESVLQIRDFIGGLTRPALLAALEQMGEDQTQAGNMPLILDLRHAGGADLFEALDLAGLFLPTGAVLGCMQGPDGHPTIFHAPPGGRLDIPLVLWVGPETVNGAEVFAGALRHHGRARIVGSCTPGQWSCQSDIRLSDSSVLRLTSRMVRPPDGEGFASGGIRPDVVVNRETLEDLSQLLALSMLPQEAR